jgi:hypothetical protein
MQICNFQTLNDVAIKEKCQVGISNRFSALENLDGDDDLDIHGACEIIRENMKASAT